MKPNSRSPARRLRVAAAQLRFRSSLRENLALIESFIARAARGQADVVLFPECATTGYAVDFARIDRVELDACLKAIGACARRHRIHVLVGSPVFQGRRKLNALLVFNSAGRLVYQYAKCQLTPGDRRWFTPGNALALFTIAGVPATAIICHERRYPELVRLPVMAGARIIFHPNAGLDSLAVSRRKRGGRDGIPVRAFENAVPYVFANSVGPQGGGRWSAGDTKIVAADGTVVRIADNEGEALIMADLDLGEATGKYAVETLSSPRFLAPDWRRMVAKVRRQARRNLPS